MQEPGAMRRILFRMTQNQARSVSELMQATLSFNPQPACLARKNRILIVDDDVSFTRLVKLKLEATNRYEVQIEKWPEDTLITASEFQPDLIILEILMPRLFGGDVAERLRADERFSSVPILFVSGAIQKSRVAEHRGVVAGFPVVAKPVTIEALIEHIEEQLGAGLGLCSRNVLCERDGDGHFRPIHEQLHESYA
jgi:CheY-like chemotaxis protein